MWSKYAEKIDLLVPGRIRPEEAQRQEMTAREIIRRLDQQPGIVLADEVGMGKTFVALAVAASVALADRKQRPVVIMIPPSLSQKWPTDAGVFQQFCLTRAVGRKFRASLAENGNEFLKLLDDDESTRANIIFLTHGAMHRGLSDRWVKLAIIQRSLLRRPDREEVTQVLSKALAELLQIKLTAAQQASVDWKSLLNRPVSQWKRWLLENEFTHDAADDPIPEAVRLALKNFKGDHVYQAMKGLPKNRTASYKDRLKAARVPINRAIQDVWRQTMLNLNIELPLIIFDEAHHLKNARTQLASLFGSKDGEADAEAVRGGPLHGVFERMLFLTATPFQLGHHELCSILERFEGVAWDSPASAKLDRKAFRSQVGGLRDRLDGAQTSALNLDRVWGRLRPEDLAVEGLVFADVEAWWQAVESDAVVSPPSAGVRAAYDEAFRRFRAAEELLRPWVIRHLKSRSLPAEVGGGARRLRLVGDAIRDDNGACRAGLELGAEQLMPFLIAARATVLQPQSRPLFAEGLASSWEAFLDTRSNSAGALDVDDVAANVTLDQRAEWYLHQLERSISQREERNSMSHPKIAATVDRVVECWRQGEKVLVFCHFIATGQVLRRAISQALQKEVEMQGALAMGCAGSEAAERVDRLGKRFFDTDSPIRRAVDAQVLQMLSARPILKPDAEILGDVIRRYVRTPSFLVRYFPLDEVRLTEEVIAAAFQPENKSGLFLLLTAFLDFLEKRCGDDERRRFLDAVNKLQTGSILDRDETATSFSSDEHQGSSVDSLLPNVRLVNGAIQGYTRQRLMLGFNSPFFPEVLVASSVMAEGVDLHRYCRLVIHHDLCWNPSTLEQRTGRLDRIDARAEQCGRPIQVYLPYLAATQDEKMYRVVTDRERWFNVVMGEKWVPDARTTETMADRVPLPEVVAQSLAFRLEVGGD